MRRTGRHSFSLRARLLRSLFGEAAPFVYVGVGLLFLACASFAPAEAPAPAAPIRVRGILRDSVVDSRADGSVRAVHFTLRNSPRLFWTSETGGALTAPRKDGADIRLEFYAESRPGAPTTAAGESRAYGLVVNGKVPVAAEAKVRTEATVLRRVLRLVGIASLLLGVVFWALNFRRQPRRRVVGSR